MAYSTAPWYHQRFFDNDGRPLASGQLAFYAAGSVAYKQIYTNLGGTPQANPLTLDSTGVPPQYFMGSGYYDIVITDQDGNLIDKVVNIEAGGGSGVVDDHLVLTNSIDTTPNYLQDKIVNTQSILWESFTVGTEQKLKANVSTSWISQFNDHLVKAEPSDPSPGTLQAKLTDNLNTVWPVNGNEQLVLPFGDYLSKVNPGTQNVLGTVNFNTITSNVLTTGTAQVNQNLTVVGNTTTGTLNAYSAVINTLGTQYLNIGSTVGVTNPVLTVDIDGNVTAVDGLYKVKVSATDTLGQYLGLKILPGTGIQFTTVTDGTGEHIAISTQTPPRLDMYKVSNGFGSSRTYNTTPKDFWTQVGVLTYGSLIIPGGTIKPGMRLRIVQKIFNATNAFTMKIAQTGSGTGSFMTINIPAGTTYLETDYQYNPTFGDVYQNREAFYHLINSGTPSISGVIPDDGQGLDIGANIAFTITCQTATGSTVVNIHDVVLWVIP